MLYKLREKLAYSHLGRRLALHLTMDTNIRAHWLQQRWAEGHLYMGGK